jgi:hypothetical protein
MESDSDQSPEADILIGERRSIMAKSRATIEASDIAIVGARAALPQADAILARSNPAPGRRVLPDQ